MDAATFAALHGFVAPAPPRHDVSKLLAFFAQEMQLFFAHIQTATVQFQETGEVPHSLFTAKAVREVEKKAAVGDKKKEKSKRKPTAFNFFVKEKIEELKASGVKPTDDRNNNALFGMAAAEWKKLSDEQKQGFQAKYSPLIAAAAASEEGEQEGDHEDEHPAAAAASAEAPAEDIAHKKKKKKHHHKESQQ